MFSVDHFDTATVRFRTVILENFKVYCYIM